MEQLAAAYFKEVGHFVRDFVHMMTCASYDDLCNRLLVLPRALFIQELGTYPEWSKQPCHRWRSVEDGQTCADG